MRVLLQRVRWASVRVDEETVARIGPGLLLLVGVGKGDDERHSDYLAQKVLHLRVFEDDQGRMNRSLRDVGGAILAVPQFTLYADARKGRRPSFDRAAPPEQAQRLFDGFVARLRESGLDVQTGVFGARMAVELLNDGPVTLLLESPITLP